MTVAAAAALRITPYQAFELSGSDISDPDSDSGYDPLIGAEYKRTGGSGTYRLTAPALRDLAEWCDALTISASQGGNPSGARSLANLAAEARKLADGLEA